MDESLSLEMYKSFYAQVSKAVADREITRRLCEWIKCAPFGGPLPGRSRYAANDPFTIKQRSRDASSGWRLK